MLNNNNCRLTNLSPRTPINVFHPKRVLLPVKTDTPKNSWAYFWSPLINQVVYGRILKFDHASLMVYMVHYNKLHSALKSSLSPRSLTPALIPCTGCTLHTPFYSDI